MTELEAARARIEELEQENAALRAEIVTLGAIGGALGRVHAREVLAQLEVARDTRRADATR